MSAGARSIQLAIIDPEGEETAPALDIKEPVFMHHLPGHIPKAISRFASPSCPWPWAGDSESAARKLEDRTPPGSREPSPTPSETESPKFSTQGWANYPTFFFPNWTKYAVKRCGIADLIGATDGHKCTTYAVDVSEKARFSKTGQPLTLFDDSGETETREIDHLLTKRPNGLRLRCICVENISGPVMQVLGAFYHIEPFFFSSAINRISSRYHEQFSKQKGDHMFITLPFLRVTKVTDEKGFHEPDFVPAEVMAESINVFVPLSLVGRSKRYRYTFQQDMLAVYLVRAEDHQTLITIHPGPVPDSARDMQDRIFMAGKGIYWGNLMRKTGDPIFVLLIVMWSALYVWDEAMEVLYTHITYLENRVLNFELADVKSAPQLHAIRAHLLYYDDLLQELNKCLDFILEVGVLNQEDTEGKALLKKEVRTLAHEVDRLRRQRNMQDSRLGNVMKLVFSKLTISETQETLRHGQSMKQITYLTMIYLPASFIASVFGMNVSEIVPQTNGTLAHFFAIMVPLAVITVWLAVAMNARLANPDEHTMLWHILWPFTMLAEVVKTRWAHVHQLRSGKPGTTQEHAGSRRGTRDDIPMPERQRERTTSRERGRATHRRSPPAMEGVSVHDFAGDGRGDASGAATANPTRAPSSLAKDPSVDEGSNVAFLARDT